MCATIMSSPRNLLRSTPFQVFAMLLAAPLSQLWACSCMGPPSTPCNAAGISSAAFTGRVLSITDSAPVVPPKDAGTASSRRAKSDSITLLPWPLRVVRMQVGMVLSGLEPGQTEIEIVTGLGGGDCGYAFQTGEDYVVYAYKNADGRLQTGICSRTRPLRQAAEDISYFQAMA